MTTEEALELATTVQLYDELAKRFDHLVFMGIQLRPTADNQQNEHRMRRFKGLPLMCQGLANDIGYRMALCAKDQEITLSADEL